jgi:hypothetical protein
VAGCGDREFEPRIRTKSHAAIVARQWYLGWSGQTAGIAIAAAGDVFVAPKCTEFQRRNSAR